MNGHAELGQRSPEPHPVFPTQAPMHILWQSNGETTEQSS